MCVVHILYTGVIKTRSRECQQLHEKFYGNSKHESNYITTSLLAIQQRQTRSSIHCRTNFLTFKSSDWLSSPPVPYPIDAGGTLPGNTATGFVRLTIIIIIIIIIVINICHYIRLWVFVFSVKSVQVFLSLAVYFQV